MKPFFTAFLCLLALNAFAAEQLLNLGTTANDGTGDSLRAAGLKLNNDITELYLNFGLATTKGDILVYNGTAWARLPAGSNGRVLTANSSAAAGLDFEAPSNTYDPANVAITGGTVSNTGAFTGTPATWLKLYRPSDGFVAFSVANDGSIVSAGTLQLAGLMRSYSASGTTFFLDGNNAVFTPAGSGQGILVDGGVVSFNDSGSQPPTPSGAQFYSISGEMHVMDSSGNDTIISPHAKDAPPALYETGAGIDEMEGKANVYLAIIQWSAVTRRKRLDYLDMTARLGSQTDSSAAWAEVLQRQGNNQILCYQTETFADYQTRTGHSRFPAAKAAAWPTMTPSQRWADAQADLVAAAQAKHQTYTAQPAPAWCTP